MPRPGLSDLTAFAEVAERRSFAQAAAALDVSASAVSHAVRALETRLGVRLLNRTTRSVAPTEAGAHLLERIRPALLDIDAALEAVNDWRERPAGVLRLNAPRVVRSILAPVAARYLAAFPEMRLEIEYEDRLVDIVADGFDAGVRFGERLERDMIAVRIGGPLRYACLASPAYLAARGVPRHPTDLARHACIRRRFATGRYYRWEFDRDGEEIEVEVDGPLSTNDDLTGLHAAAAGAGITLVLAGGAEPWLADGRLVPVLEDWCTPFPGPYLYYPSRRHVPAGLRAFIELARLSPTSAPASP